MSWLSRAVKNVADQTGRSVEDVLDEVTRTPGNLEKLVRISGKRLDPSQLWRGPHKRTPREPMADADQPPPKPADYPILSRGGESVCGRLDAWGNGQPFVLIGTIPVAAGALTQGTNIASFHLATSNPTIITADNLIPGNVEVFAAHLSIGARLVTTLGIENIGLWEAFWLIETVNGIEKARWSLRDLATMAGVTGIITSGAAHGVTRLDLPSVPWHRKYDPNVPHIAALQPTRTWTSISIQDCTFNEPGIRP